MIRTVQRCGVLLGHVVPASLVAIVLSVTFHGPASAATILQPTAVSTTAEELTPISQTIDQSGLTASYVSGVTDFDTYVAATGHGNGNLNSWLSDLIFPKLVTFDLGSPFAIDGFALWQTFPETTLKDFELFSDTDGDFGNGGTTSLGLFTAADFENTEAGVLGQSFGFSATTTQFAHMSITSGHGGIDMRVGEFAFRAVSEVPVPAAVWLFGSGLIGLIGTARRKKV